MYVLYVCMGNLPSAVKVSLLSVVEIFGLGRLIIDTCRLFSGPYHHKHIHTYITSHTYIHMCTNLFYKSNTGLYVWEKCKCFPKLIVCMYAVVWMDGCMCIWPQRYSLAPGSASAKNTTTDFSLELISTHTRQPSHACMYLLRWFLPNNFAFPMMMIPYLARVRATFNLRGSRRNPIPGNNVQHIRTCIHTHS